LRPKDGLAGKRTVLFVCLMARSNGNQPRAIPNRPPKATATVRIAFDDLKCVGSQDFPCFAAHWRHRSAFAPRVRELSELDLVIAGPDRALIIRAHGVRELS